MVCPNCKASFESQQTMCPDCFADLVEAPRQAEPVPPARPVPQVRPAGRIAYQQPPSSSGSLLSWGVAAALMLGLGAAGWRLLNAASPTSAPTQARGEDLPSAEKSLAQARHLLAQGSYGDAAREARLSLTLLGPQAGPTASRPAREALAQALLKSRSFEQAAEQYAALAGYFPEEPRFLEGLHEARTAQQVERLAEAEQAYQRARRQFSAGNFHEAADLADNASLIYASLPQGASRRLACRELAAQAYERQGAYRAAMYAWSDVLKVRPQDEQAQRGLAEAESRLQVSARAQDYPRIDSPRRPSRASLAVRVTAPVARVEAQPSYPTHSPKKDEFYGPAPAEQSEARPGRRRPVPPAAGGAAPAGGDDPYAEERPAQPAEGPPAGVPPAGAPPAAAARAPIPRLPSLSYPAGGQGNGIPGYAPAKPNTPSFPSFPGYTGGKSENNLPGYYSEKGSRSGNGGLPGY